MKSIRDMIQNKRRRLIIGIDDLRNFSLDLARRLKSLNPRSSAELVWIVLYHFQFLFVFCRFLSFFSKLGILNKLKFSVLKVENLFCVNDASLMKQGWHAQPFTGGKNFNVHLKAVRVW